MDYTDRPPPRGMTLLEVMVAVAIILLALVPLLQLQVRSLRMRHLADQMACATNLAQQQLTELSTQNDLRMGHYQGNLKGPQGRTVYHWSAQVQEVKASDWPLQPDQNLRSIQLNVMWPDGKADREVSLATVVYLKRGVTTIKSNADMN